MRMSKNYDLISKKSVAKDFLANRGQKSFVKAKEHYTRIVEINPSCLYSKYSKYIVGKAVIMVQAKEFGSTSGYYRFVHDEDRITLNRAAGWSDKKIEYLFERPKIC